MRWSVVPTSLVLTALMACGGHEPSSATRPTSAVATPLVVALGDSLTAGPGLTPDETYPSVLQQKIMNAGHPHRVVNRGVSGDTTDDARRRLDEALEPSTAVLIVALGANDGLRGVPIERVRENLSAIAQRAQQRGIRVLLCGIEAPPTHGLRYALDFHSLFPDLARQFNTQLMPFLLAGVVGRPDLNLQDGIHPNAAGARRIAENMWPYLEPLLR